MAQLIPNVDVDAISVKSERDTARYLTKLLPRDCIIYHSYPWLRAERNDYGAKKLSEGETDFVIVSPSHGLLILEVKGGNIVYDDESRAWDRVLPNGKLRSIKDPFEQARRNTYDIESKIRAKAYPDLNRIPFTFGYAVVFPDCDYKGLTPPGSDPSIIISASDLPFIDRRINSALSQWSRSKKFSKLENDDIKKIRQAISPSFKLIELVSRNVETQNEQLIRLTNEQSNLLDFLGQRQRARIEGVAGSGKTVLARKQAQKFAQLGKKVLFVCFNKSLARWVNDAIDSEFEQLITVSNYHELCVRLIEESGQKFSLPKENVSQFWKEKVPDLFVEALDKIESRFDAVIVDEGQDFYPNWWLPLELINSKGEEGAFFVFYDPKQDIYAKQGDSIPELGEPLSLTTNCRNTKSIAQKCGDILGLDIAVKEHAPEGKSPILLSFSFETKLKEAAEKTILDWINNGKLKPSQIVILSPKKKENSSLKDTQSIKGVKIVSNLDDWSDDKGVLFSTVKSFKGLEADAVVLIDVPNIKQSRYFGEADYYVACSRAKHLLVVMELD